jgi:hypothetical protein
MEHGAIVPDAEVADVGDLRDVCLYPFDVVFGVA